MSRSLFLASFVLASTSALAAPEPSTWALTLCGLVLAATTRRQRGRGQA